jgi:hypothetical protein
MKLFTPRLTASLFALLFSLSSVAATPLRGNEVRFTYRSFDGAFSYACEHSLLNESNPYDWSVRCYDGERLKGKYVAHLALSQYLHPKPPRVSLELLYWLTGSGIESEAGSTTWFHLRDETSVMEVSSSQTVDEGTAGLYLDILLERALRGR